ncbi:MAG: TetR/AcrR family transcriptional regulator [Myxococcales bacterium]|nr:TetR/AcrR family transcriptional regulator [Myxococcales bacterium]
MVARKESRPPKPPRERLGTEERREQILNASRGLFLSRRYDQVSMEDVAAQAGVSKGLVFHYFSSKRDLYVAIVQEAAVEFLAATEVPEGTEPIAMLATGLGRYLDYVEASSTGYLALLRSGLGVDPVLFDLAESVRRTLAERMLTNLPLDMLASAHLDLSSNAGLIVRGFIGFVEASSLEWLERKQMTRDELLALWIRVLSASLR